MLRVKVKPAQAKEITEQFTIGLSPVDQNTTQLAITWDQTVIALNIESANL